MEWMCWKCGTKYQTRMGMCWRCRSELIGPAFSIPPSRLDGLAETATARELWKKDFQLVSIPSYPELLIGIGAFVLLYGEPGSGKSTLATQFLLDGVRGLYLSAEEGISGGLAARVKRVGLKTDDTLFVSNVSVDGLLDLIQSRRPELVVIDSLAATTLIPSEVRRLLNTTSIKAVVAVQQVTKQGQARGTTEWLHDADVIIHVEQLCWKIEKSRYQSPIEGKIREVYNV